MSASAKVHLTWGDGEHDFRLGLKEWCELQEKCNAGLIEIMDRLAGRKWRVEDIREPLRLGLIGAGMLPTDAYALIKHYVDDRPLMESAPAAFAVLAAAVVGVPGDDDDSKKNDAATASDGTADSVSATSMEPEPPSDSPQWTWTG